MITVIVPSYNQQDFIKEAIESIYKQTMPASSVIIVDDGSTDGTPEILKELQEKYPDLHVISQANAGVAAACEVALEHVTTKYFVRIDSDDKVPENYLEALYHCLEASPKAGFAYCDAQYFGSREGWMKAREWSISALICENYIHVSSLMRTEVVRRLGYFKRSMHSGFEDWDFYLSLAESGERGVYCRDTFLFYRQKPTGGRNDMNQQAEQEMREQLRVNHRPLFQNPIHAAYRFFWRLRRKLLHWFS